MPPRFVLPRIPEKTHQAHGVQLLRSIGGKVWVVGHPSPNDGRKFRGTGQTPGLPDVLGFLPPRGGKPVLLFWEVKSTGGRLRPEQALFKGLCEDAEVAHVVGDLDALIAFLVARHYVLASQFPHYRQPTNGVAHGRP